MIFPEGVGDGDVNAPAVFNCGAAVCFGCFCAALVIILDCGVGVAVGVGDGEDERRPYFICPNAAEAMRDAMSIRIMNRVIIESRRAFRFRLAIAKPKFLDRAPAVYFQSPKPYCHRDRDQVEPSRVIPTERRMLDRTNWPAALWN